MNFDDVEGAVRAAKLSLAVADRHVGQMVRLSANRLRSVELDWETVEALRAIKRELRDFDIRTGRWK